jgi:hypothetical protein
MAAITLPGTLPLPAPRPLRRPVLVPPPVAVPPALHRHRRLLVLVAVAVVAFALQFLVGAALRAAAPAVSAPATAQPAVPPSEVPAAAGADLLVVQPGDTLWSIAQSLQPGADVRPVVDALVARNGGSASLQAGQRLDVSGLRA